MIEVKLSEGPSPVPPPSETAEVPALPPASKDAVEALAVPAAADGAVAVPALREASAPQALAPAGDTPRHRADLILNANVYGVYEEEGVDAHLAEIGVIEDSAQVIRVLRRYVVGWRARSEYERIYGLIWASQISLLRNLNGGRELMTEQARQLFNASLLPVKDENAFIAWLGFLESVALLNRTGDRITLTRKGYEFLMFLVLQGKPDPWF